MSTQINRRNLLRPTDVNNPRGKPTILSKTAIQFCLHVGTLRPNMKIHLDSCFTENCWFPADADPD